MHTLLHRHMADATARARREPRAPRRAARASREPASVVIRPANGADAPAVEALAALDGTSATRAAFGDALARDGVLLAEVDGAVRAALPVTGGRAVADPFVPSAALSRLLELRALQLRRAAA